MRTVAIILAAMTVAICGCKGNHQEAKPPQTAETRQSQFEISSPAFAEGDSIPARYTCSGQDVSPELRWKGAPNGTRSFALIFDDPDAPGRTWVHWVAWAIPASVTSLSEAIPPDPVLTNGIRQGTNDSKRIGYGGPCPPPRKPHRYFFKLYALDTIPDLEPGATKQDLLDAIEGHILAQARLMGTFSR